jgi:hypothetical protein
LKVCYVTALERRRGSVTYIISAKHDSYIWLSVRFSYKERVKRNRKRDRDDEVSTETEYVEHFSLSKRRIGKI